MRDQECTTDGNHVFNKRDRQIIPSERLYQPDPKFMSAQSPDNAATYARQHQIQILSPLITPTFVDRLYTVGEQYTVIVGQPLQIVTALTVAGYIRTWYKFKVSEVLTKQPHVPMEPLEEFWPPAALLPLGSDELLLSSVGGSI
jgi:hypothetical protein